MWDGVPGVIPVEGRAVSHGCIVAYAEIGAGTESLVSCCAVGFSGGGFADWFGAPGVLDRVRVKGQRRCEVKGQRRCCRDGFDEVGGKYGSSY